MSRRNYKPRSRKPLIAAATLVAIVITVLLLGRSGPEPGSPEAQIRQLIERAKAGAEARSLEPFEEILAEPFTTQRSIDKKRALKLLQLHYLRNQTIHLLSRIKSLEVDGEHAMATVMVAMAGKPIEDFEAVISMRADLHRFELELQQIDGEWQIVSAEWRRSSVMEELAGATP